MKFILVSPKNRTVYNFRGDLIKEIIKKGYEVVVTGPNDIDVDKIEALGARFVKIPMNKTGVNPLADIKYYRNLKKLFKREKPDVVLGYTIKPVIYGSLAAKKAKVPNINAMITGVGYLFVATTFKAKLLRKIAKFMYKRGLKSASNVIFQNPDDLEEFVEKKLVDSDKCKLVNGSGVNMDHFRPEPFPKQLTFFMLSRLLYSKGVREYLEAARIVKAKYPDVRFMLLGAIENLQDSMKYDEIKPYIQEGIVEHFGETVDVRSYYKQTSVYVLPSYREGMPRTVLEAMAMGRPVVTTNVPGCKETVVHKKTGYVIKARNPRALVLSIMKYIEQPRLIDLHGNASYKYCKIKFDVKRLNQLMLKHMNTL